MIFISYSRNDIEIVRPIVNCLREAGHDCWLDEMEIPVGEAFVRHLGEGLLESDTYLLFDTTASGSSYWVSRERATAFRIKRFSARYTVARIGDIDKVEPGSWDFSVSSKEDGVDRLLTFFSKRQKRIILPGIFKRRPESNIRYGEFEQPRNWIGRQDELRILDEWWLSHRNGAWIQGVGGTGKTGLLQTWVTALDVLGYSQSERLTILYAIGREPVPSLRKAFSEFLGMKGKRLRKLAVIDGFDESSQMNELLQFIEELTQRGIQLLISSRTEAPDVLRQSFLAISLNEMSKRDAVALAIESGVDNANANEIAEKLGGHPLAMRMFMQYIETSTDGDTARALRLLEENQSRATGDLPNRAANARPLIEKAITALSEAAKCLLSELVKSKDDEGLGDELKTFVSSDEGAAALSELTRVSLIQIDSLKKPRKVSIHPLIRTYLAEVIEQESQALTKGSIPTADRGG